MTITVDQAGAEGLDPCRVCDPPPAEKTNEPDGVTARSETRAR